MLGEVTGQPVQERVEEVLEEVAAAFEGPSDRGATTGSAVEAWPGELTLVYEISAEELPPDEIELAEDHFEPPETSPPQAPPTPERTADVPLPYEARTKRRRVVAGRPAGRTFAGGRRKGRPGSAKRSSTIKRRRKPKPPAPDGTPKPGLPAAG